MTTTINSDIANKVQMLLNKTIENGATQAEAETAAKIAQSLIEKYRLDLAELESKIDDIGEQGAIDQLGSVITWKVDLANTIANTNGCKLIIRTTRGYRGKVSSFIVIGKASDANIAKCFYNNLVEVIESTCKVTMSRTVGASGKTWSNSFKLGMVTAIRTRLDEGKREARKEANCNALVKLDNRDKEVQNWISKHMRLKSRAGVSSNINGSAYSAGIAAGKGINLSGKVLK